MFRKNPVLMDGATGTQLQKLGMPAGCCTEQWVLDNPEKFVAVQRAYVDAGSRLVYAPTFGANRVNLKNHGVDGDLDAMCASLVELSRQAADGRALVIGDISSTGLQLEPYGDTEEEELLDVFVEQARALEKAGVDLFGIETQLYLDEAWVAAKAVRMVSNRPLIISFTCGPTGKTLWGEDLRDVVDKLMRFDLTAFGVNCCGDLDLLCRVLEELHEHTELPLIAKPNAGLPEMRGGVPVYNMPPETMGEYAVRFMERGARLIGGCCGTDARHIAAIKAAVNAAIAKAQ